LLLYFPAQSPQGEGYDLLVKPANNPKDTSMPRFEVFTIECKLKEHCHWQGKLDTVNLDENFKGLVWKEVLPKEQEVWFNPDIYGNGEEEKEEEKGKCLVQ
jgi:hypothetical protein